MPKRNGYTEPTDYFPKEIRKKAKIGEFAETAKKAKTTKKGKKAVSK